MQKSRQNRVHLIKKFNSQILDPNNSAYFFKNYNSTYTYMVGTYGSKTWAS